MLLGWIKLAGQRRLTDMLGQRHGVFVNPHLPACTPIITFLPRIPPQNYFPDPLVLIHSAGPKW